MKRRLNPRLPLTAALTLVAALALAGDEPTAAPPAEPATPGEDAAAAAEDTPAGAAGLRVRLDPATGRILEGPGEPRDAPPAGIDSPRHRLNTYGGDLLEEPLPEGGFKVDLRGRFRSAVVATIDPATGEVEIDCVPAPAAEEAGDDG